MRRALIGLTAIALVFGLAIVLGALDFAAGDGSVDKPRSLLYLAIYWALGCLAVLAVVIGVRRPRDAAFATAATLLAAFGVLSGDPLIWAVYSRSMSTETH